ncbi:hypothetical protein KOR42_02500 [Thalassoglobus neptunius]|uniref:Uncharacterized protein n=1 Tax=Thalassoglobus neptunius TaxID=1938619 RepID=A0A5C5X3Y3_9PLAN|nr:hypothetical protein [Thalassoglobus neptunius]TWT56895.1 hypothetical protein KOR42_02500 [Thalassoglobus neptunius]
MKNPEVPGLIFGGALVVLSIFMLRAQRKAFRVLSESEESRAEKQFLGNRIRRRTQVAGMIGIIGLMIPIGDSLIDWRNAAATFAVYWLIVLALAFWTIILAFADIAATHAHTSIELNQIKRQQRELESVAEQLRQAQNRSSSEQDS